MRSDRALNLAIAGAVVAVCAAAIALVGVVAIDLRLEGLVGPARPQPSVAASPGPSAAAMTGNGVVITDQASCSGCHASADGVMLKPIPVLGHPLEGWRNCSACHAPGRLVAVAPGHASLTQDQCLSCHKPRNTAADAVVPRPHHVYPGQECSSCHGPNKQAPMPEAMAGRTACWLCHHELLPGASAAPSAGPTPLPAAGEPLPLPAPGAPIVRPVPSELPLPGDLVLGVITVP